MPDLGTLLSNASSLATLTVLASGIDIPALPTISSISTLTSLTIDLSGNTFDNS